MNLYHINSKNGGIKMKENKKKIVHKLTYNYYRSSLQFIGKNKYSINTNNTYYTKQGTKF